MKLQDFLHQSWIQKLQGDYVLPAARIAYLGIAGLSLLAALLGIAAVIVFEIERNQSTAPRPVPDMPPPPAVSINLDAISQGFKPPTNIRVIPLRFSRPVSQDTLLIYLDADSPHGLAAFPDDFFILGGRDAALFERASVSVDGRAHTGFKPTQALVDQLNKPWSGQTFTIRVAAKDSGGSVSQPTSIRFTLTPDSPPPPATPSGPPPATALEKLARQIALFADPHRTPIYFSAYQQALSEPETCGTSRDDANFVTEYARAFDYMQTKMSRDKLDGFYAELCSAWKAGVRTQAMAIEQAQVSHNQAIAQSLSDQFKAEASVFAAGIARNTALIFTGVAIAVFLFLSLFLAFLAMENHSKAMREILATLAKSKEAP